ncbi:MAG: hypothetical protein J7641_03605 [Cyanobacteria bacterium SID2]|nr:hypothetical protein [Cyanobacteria bacterium SID2]MBP0003161.1 hypothetical protein [Cyanobacteria bacterium SBC]
MKLKFRPSIVSVSSGEFWQSQGIRERPRSTAPQRSLLHEFWVTQPKYASIKDSIAHSIAQLKRGLPTLNVKI